MLAWRICKEKHSATPLDGEGARRFPGRWNHLNTPVAYCAESASLAAMETLVHADAEDLPSDTVCVCVEIPDGLPVRTLSIGALPAGWDAPSGPVALKDLAGKWISDAQEAVLIVPSAVVNLENLVLINPLHSDAARIKVISSEPFIFDPRLRKPPAK